MFCYSKEHEKHKTIYISLFTLSVCEWVDVPKQRWFWRTDGLSQWELSAGGFADTCIPTCAPTTLVSAAERPFQQTVSGNTRRSRLNTDAGARYLACSAAVACHLALGASWQRFAPKRIDRGNQSRHNTNSIKKRIQSMSGESILLDLLFSTEGLYSIWIVVIKRLLNKVVSV